MKYTFLALLILSPSAAFADKLPKVMIGKWASDPTACGEQSSELGLTVEPKSVLFYEHGYEVRKIVRKKGGVLKASGYSVDDQGRAPGSITLKIIGPDKLQAGSGVYHRCK